MTEEQKGYLECYKVAAEFCGQTNRANDRTHYNHNDLHNIAMVIAKTIGIIK